MTLVHSRIEAARAGTDPALICHLPSGWLFLCNLQFLRGYCVLQADPEVESLNALSPLERGQFLEDMATVGDALIEALGAYRINYVIAGNSDPVLHAHIVPRYPWKPEEYKRGLPWSYPEFESPAHRFDRERDRALMEKIRAAVLARGGCRKPSTNTP